jgi:Fe-S-cluster containining protein
MNSQPQQPSCSNCKLFHRLCKSACCGPVPIDKKVYAENHYLLQRSVEKTFDLGTTIVPVTSDMVCPFLASDHSCMIYNDRPDVCKKYGDESDILMTCAYQTADGKARSRKETRKISTQQHKQILNRTK